MKNISIEIKNVTALDARYKALQFGLNDTNCPEMLLTFIDPKLAKEFFSTIFMITRMNRMQEECPYFSFECRRNNDTTISIGGNIQQAIGEFFRSGDAPLFNDALYRILCDGDAYPSVVDFLKQTTTIQPTPSMNEPNGRMFNETATNTPPLQLKH